MLKPLALLSYTRKDDDFFGGYITSFRKVLENAVHVVTGEGSFQIFQDIEGIVIGENWQKKLTEVISDSCFFVPMLTPLFLNSKPCRDEVNQFLEHERALERDDLILPIYFLTTAKLEKEDKKADDPLAVEIAKRQMFDWRKQANVPLQNAESREAILTLAREIEKAMGRLEPELPRMGGAPEAPGAVPGITAGIDADAQREELNPRTILWVDDNPDNNILERQALESYGMQFVLARNTLEAERQLQENGPFSAVISDVGREGDSDAGYTLLSRIRKAKNDVPYFLYTAGLSAKLQPLAKLRGAQGLTADPDVLVEKVVSAVR